MATARARPALPASRSSVQRQAKPSVPTYLTIPEVATLFGRGLEPTRRWLLRRGLIEYRGGRPCVVPEKLRAEFPEAYNRMLLDADND